MMKPIGFTRDTTAWVVQVWAAFILSLTATTIGVTYLPVDNWVKGCLGVSVLFSLSSSFTLAKTIRDNQEANKLNSKIEEARVEKILAEHHPLK
ncbi:MAG: hypothetical protein HC916_21595 [Coleofasciculaceae cyanobacterium SM2_1_6]|nr:hypothetical protein [Coleofasciculaceae cyanobacterium SM2_1_6]